MLRDISGSLCFRQPDFFACRGGLIFASSTSCPHSHVERSRFPDNISHDGVFAAEMPYCLFNLRIIHGFIIPAASSVQSAAKRQGRSIIVGSCILNSNA